MNEAQERVLAALTIMGRRYIREFLLAEEIDRSRLRSDWFYAFNFLLSKLYFQGRNDSLSDRYLQNMKSCLECYFSPNHTTQLHALWQNHHIPHDPEWKNFRINSSPLWNAFNEQMGKRRDREMVMDVLRYIHCIPGHNIVNHSIEQIEGGQIKNHREELMLLWGVGPKTSAFYLRDVIFLFNCALSLQESLELQPIDTWVRQVVDSLRDDQTEDDQLPIPEWLILHSEGAHNAALLNAGSWYLGKHSFEIALKILAMGAVPPEALEEMELGII